MFTHAIILEELFEQEQNLPETAPSQLPEEDSRPSKKQHLEVKGKKQGKNKPFTKMQTLYFSKNCFPVPFDQMHNIDRRYPNNPTLYGEILINRRRFLCQTFRFLDSDHILTNAERKK